MEQERATPLAELLPPADFLALLDDYFECTAGAVLIEGGEVLAFIGDAVLAIFPTAPSGEQAACAAAVAAARRTAPAAAELSAGKPCSRWSGCVREPRGPGMLTA